MFRAAGFAGIPSYTWATKPAGVSSGALIFVSDVGEYGTVFQYTGSRWRALNGTAALKTLGAATANITNTETIVMQTQIPAGSWQTNDAIRVWLTATKSGATDSGNLSVRIGTAGTTADTAITGLSAFGLMAASGATGAGIFDIKLLGATSAQKVGGNNVNTHAYQNASGSTAGAAATTITDATANALYISVTMASSGATNTVQMLSGQIQLITP